MNYAIMQFTSYTKLKLEERVAPLPSPHFLRLYDSEVGMQKGLGEGDSVQWSRNWGVGAGGGGGRPTFMAQVRRQQIYTDKIRITQQEV